MASAALAETRSGLRDPGLYLGHPVCWHWLSDRQGAHRVPCVIGQCGCSTCASRASRLLDDANMGVYAALEERVPQVVRTGARFAHQTDLAPADMFVVTILRWLRLGRDRGGVFVGDKDRVPHQTVG